VSADEHAREAESARVVKAAQTGKAPHWVSLVISVWRGMTLRLADDETEALRRRAELEHRSMQEVARQAIREYVENHSRAELLDQVLDEALPRFAEALERLGQ
jgi:hypothetical protein